MTAMMVILQAFRLGVIVFYLVAIYYQKPEPDHYFESRKMLDQYKL